MLNLLFVAPSVRYGGAAKNFIGIANYMVSRGHKVVLLTQKGKEPMRYIDPQIVQITSQIDDRDSLITKYVKAIRDIRKAIKKYDINVSISFIEFWRSATIIATRASKAKCVVSERADPYFRGGRHDQIIFKIFGMAEGHVFQTEMARDYFPKHVKEKSVVIPNPVFSEDILDEYKGQKKNLIVNIARLDLRQKRQDVLIHAFKGISEKYPCMELFLYGSGPDEDKIRDLVHRLDLDDRVFLKGVTNNVYQAIGEAKITILTSDFEGIPNSIIESMCVGVPVISTKCSPGGAELLIQDHENGILVERENSSQISDAIIELLEDDALYKKIVDNGFFVKERFAQDKILCQWEDYLKSISEQ